MKDPYEVMGLSRDATDEDIHKQYRKLAKKHHPDRNPGDKQAEDIFKEVANAYEILGDPVKRREYDSGGPGSNVPWQASDPMHDVFDSFFNFKRQPDTDGTHIEAELNISFMESAYGCKKLLEFDRRESCSSCKGTGAKDGEELKDCVVCDGRGKTFQRFGGGGGFIKVETICSSCRGSGKVISAFCANCHARGFVMKNAEMEINVPAGVEDGMRVSIRGQGDKGLNGGQGNLYCTIRVAQHSLFKRVSKDIHMTLPISYTQAVFGDKIEIPYPFGRADLVIPPGTKTGSMFKLHGLGLPDLRLGGTGNLVVKVEVDIPKALGNEYSELLKRLADIEKVNLSPGIAEFKDKVKVMYEN